MRIVSIFLILFLFIGCNPPNIPPTIDIDVDCEAVPEFWFGNAGDDPSKNDVWKCYDWVLQNQEFNQ